MEEKPKNFFASTTGIIVVVALLIMCCCCIVILAAGGVALYEIGSQASTIIPAITEIFDFPTETPAPPAQITRIPAEEVSGDALETLRNTIVPVNDDRELACRLLGKCNIPETLPSGPFKAGDEQRFWVNNMDSNENFQVDATLRYVTDHAYFWVENGVNADQGEIEALTDAFEEKIYPTNREFFGSEWSPGIDEDPRIYILYARGLGYSIAGYFSSADQVHPDAHEYSNAHEMFIFNADNTNLSDDFTYGVLAHEFQHMIHWNQDLNETSWLNEGSSELAAFINGYDIGGFDYSYISDTDLQLNDWPNDQNATTPHYGASFLFMAYFLDRFGEQATQDLVKSPSNGMDSVDKALSDINATDPLTGNPIFADDVFQDWAITNFLHDDSVSDGRFEYGNYRNAPQAYETETVASCPQDMGNRTVKQYGVDYIGIMCQGDYTLHFEGATATRILPEDPFSGKYAFWSNKGDESDMTLTREFDFSNASGPIEITYQTWYDIEEGWDYLYLLASTDGVTWQILDTTSCTTDDPSGNSFGCGYSGVSNGWQEETADLSQYAGQKVQLRFEYVTDAAVNGEGLLLDDISIPAVGYSTDFEADNGGWEPNGFARIENVLPQTFRISLILKGNDTTVQYIELDENNGADVSFSLRSGDQAVLVVSGTTRFTREPAVYSIEIK